MGMGMGMDMDMDMDMGTKIPFPKMARARNLAGVCRSGRSKQQGINYGGIAIPILRGRAILREPLGTV